MSNATPKTKSGRSKRNLPNKRGNVLQTRFGVASVFQPGQLLDGGKGDAETSNANIPTIIEQIGFDGRRYRYTILLPVNSDIWRKLSTKRKDSKRSDE